MQDVLTYEAWLDAVCHICNSLLKANVSIIGNEFKVVASKYRWITFIDEAHIRYAYRAGFDKYDDVIVEICAIVDLR